MTFYKAHITFAIILLGLVLIFSKITDLGSIVTLTIIAVIYSILPDVDIGSSVLGRISRFLLIATGLIMFYFKQYVYGAIALIALLVLIIVKHRGFFHTIRAGIIFSIPLIFISWSYFALGILIYMSHLFMDKQIKF